MRRRWRAALAAALLPLAVPAARAADDAFCKDYARAALNQRHALERHRRCEHFMREEPGRWNREYRAHYDWCRTVPPGKAREEREARKRDLERCEKR